MRDVNEQQVSFEKLLKPHLDRLYRFAGRLTDCKTDAEDLFQDVLTKVYPRLADLFEIEAPGSWLCRIMYNHFIDNRRRYARQRLVSVSEAELPGEDIEALGGERNAEDDAARREHLEQLDRALAELSEEHRLVVLLHDCEGYKLKEIQSITNVPIGTLKSRLHRARTRLREILDVHGTKSTL